MGFINKYPYTDFHELNLDWLLTTYQQIVDDIKDIQDWVEQHEIDYAEAIRRLTIVENEISTFEARVQAEFQALSDQINTQLEENQRRIQQMIDDAQAELDRQIVEFRNQMLAIQTQLENEIVWMHNEINRTINDLRRIQEANNEFIFNWVEIRLQQFIDSLPEILTVQVYNPYRGAVTDIQTAVNDLFELTRTWALTAAQYDSLQLTASEYDALQLTAQQYDTIGYRLLFKDPTYYMLDPFTGEWIKTSEVVLKLAGLHMNALTATEYDALDLDADTYDAKDLTAYDYDWNGAALLP